MKRNKQERVEMWTDLVMAGVVAVVVFIALILFVWLPVILWVLG